MVDLPIGLTQSGDRTNLVLLVGSNPTDHTKHRSLVKWISHLSSKQIVQVRFLQGRPIYDKKI
jgi:hypothetical protein